MLMLTRSFGAGAIALAGLALDFGAALAGEPVTVHTDHSRVMSLARPPATIVVGNPSIADVTIQGNEVLLHARTYGQTNVIILDENGQQLADYDVTVQTGGDNNVYVFSSGMFRTSYLCAPDCESILHTGDYKDYFNLVAGQQQKRSGIATNQKVGENVAQSTQPAAPAQ
jgi:hypothetical protein